MSGPEPPTPSGRMAFAGECINCGKWTGTKIPKETAKNQYNGQWVECECGRINFLDKHD